MKRISIGSDHAGFAHKERLREALGSVCVVEDLGPSEGETAGGVDYPDYAHQVARRVENGGCDMGIVLCGSGNGVNMVANRYPKVRAALCWSMEIACYARRHNDANVLSLPARFISQREALKIAKVFLCEAFEGHELRHRRRIKKIPNILG